MPALSKDQAAERLAAAVETAKASALAEFYAELFPERPVPAELVPGELAFHVRHELEVEEIVDLWNVVFPEDRDVWYDEEENTIRYNEATVGYAD
ncbi:MAG: hypothetical protein WD875_02785 [Pirellulales bacterium]